MNILVTGAAGFIGSNLVKRLAKNKNNKVYSLVLKGTSEKFLKNIDTQIIYGDVTKPETLNKTTKNIDLVYHLAAIPSDWWNKSILEVNYGGTKNILGLAIKNGVKRFIFMSSLVVHGFDNFDGATEETPIIDSKSVGRPYIKSKILCEELINKRKNEIETCIIRPGFTIFGQNDLMFTYDLINTLESGGFYAFLNGGKAKMCYSYVQNLVDGLVLAGTHKNAANETFILCDGEPEYTTLRDITHMICNEFDIDTPTTSIPYWLGYPFISFYENIARFFGKKNAPRLTVYRLRVAKYDLFFKSHKAKELINYDPKIDLKTAIRESIQWYKKYKNINNIKN